MNKANLESIVEETKARICHSIDNFATSFVNSTSNPNTFPTIGTLESDLYSVRNECNESCNELLGNLLSNVNDGEIIKLKKVNTSERR